MKMINKNDIVYIGIQLDEKSKMTLLMLTMTKLIGHLTEFGKFYCDHITVAFGDKVNDELIKNIGTNKAIRHSEVEYDLNEGICYLPVKVKGVEHAHITMATNGMVAPVRCGQYMASHPVDREYVDLLGLRGTMVAYMKDGSIIESLED